ncbi:MAG: hypothetical protein NTW21_21870 [Verrucomicrobia bacterium]|nr:hypothetical protein [Verrucomicrobiota bacterium]
MNPPLTDDVWKRKGISVLWDVAGLASLGSLQTAISLREFFLWNADDWREDSTHARFSGGARRIVVAGLEAALDCMEPEAAEEWMAQQLLPVINRCAEILFEGGTGGALLFWMVKHDRFRVKLENGEILWTCDGEHRDRKILFSHGLWNGAYRDVQRIAPLRTETEPGLGFYLQRIS